MKNNNTLYVTIIIVVSIVSVTVLLIFSPNTDNVIQLTLHLLGFSGLMVSQMLNNNQMKKKISDVHELVNGRMSEFIESNKAEWISEGRRIERDISDGEKNRH